MTSSLLSALEDERPSFSVELWPPRSERAQERLEDALVLLKGISPDFASITYGAAGSTRERTHELVKRLAHENWTIPMAHVTCAAHTRSELQDILQGYKAVGVNHILALRGDPPLESVGPLAEGELTYALELVELAKSLGDLTVAVAAHPEGHPDSPSLVEDRKMLARKLEVADFAITQFYFQEDSYPRLLEELATLGVSRPIVPGVMAPASWRVLQKMADLSGTTVPAELAARFDALSDDPKGTSELGVEIAVDLAQKALAEGAPGVHVYTMNSAETTLQIYAALKGDLRR